MLRLLAVAGFAILLSAQSAAAQSATPPDRPGDTYEIRLRYEMESESSDLSSSSAHGGYFLVERVIAVRDDGIELEFDRPLDTTETERARDWQFPVRVLRTPDGDYQLLNASQLETRIDAWLAFGGIPREACGHWIFTWNAFKIECDPQSVIETLEPFDLRPVDLRDGAHYELEGAQGPAVLQLESATDGGATYTAAVAVDPDAVRRARAETDVVVGEISGEPVTIEEALSAHSGEEISGEISLTLQVDAAGRVVGRRIVTQIESVTADGVTESQTRTDTAERLFHAVSSAAGD